MSAPDDDSDYLESMSVEERWAWRSGYEAGYAEALRRAGVITGESADVILREMREGTPDTPERRATMARADEMYRRFWPTESAPTGPSGTQEEP
jgi:hypothetical protein